MKTKDQKYEEAVDRNIFNAEKKKKYQGMTLAEAMYKLGIRDSDKRFNSRIAKLIK